LIEKRQTKQHQTDQQLQQSFNRKGPEKYDLTVLIAVLPFFTLLTVAMKHSCGCETLKHISQGANGLYELGSAKSDLHRKTYEPFSPQRYNGLSKDGLMLQYSEIDSLRTWGCLISQFEFINRAFGEKLNMLKNTTQG
jgi:hypothetical protein